MQLIDGIEDDELRRLTVAFAVELDVEVKKALVTGLTLLAQVDNENHYFEKHQIVVAVAKVLGLTT